MTEYQKQAAPTEYIEIRLEAPRELEERLTMLLFDLGAEGVEVADNAIIMRHLAAGDWDASVFDGQELPTARVSLRALTPLDAAGRAMAEAVLAEAGGLPDVDIYCDVVPPQDWQEKWKEGFVARPVGDRLWIRPYWDETPPPEGRIPINVNPGMAFGTGDHPTTEMALELIEEYLQPGERVVDFGCGSGILAIAALKLGASEAIAVDIDEVCGPAVAEHLRINDLPAERLRFYAADILADDRLQRSLRREKGQLVLANINAEVLRDLAGVAGRFMAPGGYFIASGILADYAGPVAKSLIYAGLAIIGQRQVGDWVSYVAVAAYE